MDYSLHMPHSPENPIRIGKLVRASEVSVPGQNQGHADPIPGAERARPRIGDYGIIGDCRAAALVSTKGSIDWLCWPRFDKGAIFAALLDRELGGFWRISPIERCSVSRSYLDDSNLLQTRFEGSSGKLVLTDLMPAASETAKRNNLFADHEIIRVAECVGGEIEIEIRFAPRANYG